MRYATFPAPLIWVSAITLTGCVSSSPLATPSQEIYAPPSVVLPAGVPLKTRDGTYTPTTDEIWHSHREFMTEREAALAALSALSQARNNR